LFRRRHAGPVPEFRDRTMAFITRKDYMPVFLKPAEIRGIPGLAVPKGMTCTVQCPFDMGRDELLAHLKSGNFTTLAASQRVLFVVLKYAANCSGCGEGLKLDHKPAPGRAVHCADCKPGDCAF
jgi:hypothetical protein